MLKRLQIITALMTLLFALIHHTIYQNCAEHQTPFLKLFVYSTFLTCTEKSACIRTENEQIIAPTKNTNLTQIDLHNSFKNICHILNNVLFFIINYYHYYQQTFLYFYFVFITYFCTIEYFLNALTFNHFSFNTRVN